MRWLRRWFAPCPACHARSKAEVSGLIVCTGCGLPLEVLV